MTLFERTKRWLRKEYPVPLAIRVYVLDQADEKMNGCAGWFIFVGEGKAIIYIAHTNAGAMSETLIEEWAHAIRHVTPLEVDYENEAHDEHFWVTYGRITNAWRRKFLT